MIQQAVSIAHTGGPTDRQVRSNLLTNWDDHKVRKLGSHFPLFFLFLSLSLFFFFFTAFFLLTASCSS